MLALRAFYNLPSLKLIPKSITQLYSAYLTRLFQLHSSIFKSLDGLMVIYSEIKYLLKIKAFVNICHFLLLFAQNVCLPPLPFPIKHKLPAKLMDIIASSSSTPLIVVWLCSHQRQHCLIPRANLLTPLIFKQRHACSRSDQLKLMKHTNTLVSESALCARPRDAIRVITHNYCTNLINGLTLMMDIVKTVHGGIWLRVCVRENLIIINLRQHRRHLAAEE